MPQRFLSSLTKMVLLCFLAVLPCAGMATSVSEEACSAVIPTENPEFASFMTMPEHEFVKRMVDILRLEDPLVKGLLSRADGPDEQWILIHYFVGGNDIWQFFPRRRDISEMFVSEYLKFLPQLMSELANPGVLPDTINGFSVEMTMADPRDQQAIQTSISLYKAFTARKDVQKALQTYLTAKKATLPRVLDPFFKFHSAYHTFTKARLQRLPDGRFQLSPAPSLPIAVGKGSLVIGAMTAASYFTTSLLWIWPFLLPDQPSLGVALSELTASSALYFYIQWRQRHADYFRYRKAKAKMARLTQRRPSIFTRVVHAIDAKLAPQDKTLQVNHQNSSTPYTLAPFHEEWLAVPTQLNLNLHEDRYQFFSGLLHSINWLQSQWMALHKDQYSQQMLIKARSLVETARAQKNEHKQREGLYQFSLLYVELGKALAQRMDFISQLQERILDISAGLDAHLDYAEPYIEDPPQQTALSSVQDLASQTFLWSQWPEYLVQLNDSLQLEKDSLSMIRNTLQGLLPHIMTVQTGGASASSGLSAREILDGVWTVVGGQP